MSHDHHRSHDHAPGNYNRAFAMGIVLNTVFVAIEAFYGWRVNSRHTYGWKRATILAAFANALLLLVAMGGLAWEAIGRLLSGEVSLQEQGVTIMVVAGIGIVINTATALLFMRGRESDLNIRGAFMHMAADALVSAGVVVAGALTLWMGWTWLDPVTSLAIAGVILLGTWGLFKQSLHMLFDGVPDSVDPQAVHDCLAALPGVSRVHDLHIWAMGTSHFALTAQLVMPHGHANDAFLQDVTHQMHDRFEITHVTLQVVKVPFSEACGSVFSDNTGAAPTVQTDSAKDHDDR